MKRAIIAFIVGIIAITGLSACTTDSDANVVSQNISTDADNFKILRRIVAVNGITDKYILEVEGFCNIVADTADHQLEITCKVGNGYIKDYVGQSDNVFYSVTQLMAANVSPNHYKIVWKPETILPEFEVR